MVRFGGLSTGQDTQAIVDAMLEVERAPINRLENEIVEHEEKYAAWSELDTKVSDLYSKKNKLTSYLTWRQNDVTNTDENVVTGSADHNAAQGTYDVNVIQLAQSHMVGSASQASTSDPLTYSGSFVLNGETINVTAADSLETIRDNINTAADNMSDKVTATIINTTLVIQRENTGDTDISITDSGTPNNAAEQLGLAIGSTFSNELRTSEGLNATVNGVAVTSANNTNLTSVISGVTLNFKGAGTSILEVERDTETIKTAFEEFVDAYNSVMELAEEQSEVTLSGGSTQVDNVGVLQGDTTVSSMRFRARSLITGSFDDALSNGNFNNLQSIGIWTEGRANRLSIFSSDRLDDALNNNFDEVEDLIRDFDKGIIKQFGKFVDELQSPVDGTIARRQSSLRNNVNDKQDRIDAINLLILNKEQELFEHFATMEAAVGSIQSQGSFLSSQLG